MNKQLTIEEFVASLKSGMTIGIAGWGPRRKPMALIRAILRSDLTDLTIVAYGGPEVGMLCAAGKVKKLIFGFVSMDAIPLEPYFRKAREAGTLDILELDEGMLQWGLKAAAFHLPFLPTHVGLGTDVMTHGGFKTVQSPYDDGEVLLAMPAVKLDAALLHVHRADKLGNIQALGPDTYYDEWFAREHRRALLHPRRRRGTTRSASDLNAAFLWLGHETPQILRRQRARGWRLGRLSRRHDRRRRGGLSRPRRRQGRRRRPPPSHFLRRPTP